MELAAGGAVGTTVGPFHPKSVATLAALAVAAALLWRAEVEWHGWEGLIWVSAPHRAVPIGALAFVAWTLTTDVAPSSRTARAGLFVAGCAWAGFALPLLEMLLRTIQGRWLFPPDAQTFGTIVYATATILISTPVVAFLLGRIAGAELRGWTLPLSTVLFAAAIPLGTVAIGLLEPGRSADIDHAVKTGQAIPFAVLGMGLPWITRRR